MPACQPACQSTGGTAGRSTPRDAGRAGVPAVRRAGQDSGDYPVDPACRGPKAGGLSCLPPGSLFAPLVPVTEALHTTVSHSGTRLFTKQRRPSTSMPRRVVMPQLPVGKDPAHGEPTQLSPWHPPAGVPRGTRGGQLARGDAHATSRDDEALLIFLSAPLRLCVAFPFSPLLPQVRTPRD